MKNKNSKILVMDSGFGGLSILKKLRVVLPNEDYIYFGDSKNAPYGEKTVDEVFNLASNVIKTNNDNYDLKAVVIACNTTTVSNFDKIKDAFPDLIFVGTTPNISNMVSSIKDGEFLVLSTPITSKSEYIKNEILKYPNRVIKTIGMPGLMNFVEELNFDINDLYSYLDKNLLPHINSNVKAISLGCTHYPFLKDIMDEYLKDKGIVLDFFDSSDIVANTLKMELDKNNLLSDNEISGELTILNSINDNQMIEKSFELLER